MAIKIIKSSEVSDFSKVDLEIKAMLMLRHPNGTHILCVLLFLFCLVIQFTLILRSCAALSRAGVQREGLSGYGTVRRRHAS